MATISLTDNGFLLTESPSSPKHVAVLQVWQLPKGKGSAWLRRLLADLKGQPAGFPFDQKLNYRIPLQPELVDDPLIDMDYHVRHTVLPFPGDDEQLWKTVSRLHANLLDRERPLWEFHLIEGLSDRRFAFYTKIHHALADGVTLSRWFSESGSADPRDVSTPPIWHGQKKISRFAGKEPTYAKLIGEGIAVMGGGIRTALDMSTLAIRLVNRRFFEKNRDITLPLSAAKTPLNVSPGAARFLTATTFPLESIKAIARSQEVSVNDVLLTICDVAINRYFEEKGVPLKDPLVVYMPVNLRTKTDQEAGNLVSLLQVRLAADTDDPIRALHQIRASSITAREVFSGFGKPAIQLYALTVALLSLFEETLKLDRILPPVQNLVISNVPGPPKTMYFRGAEGLNAYPISTLPPMTALNVTANSYAGVMHVGLVAGRTAMPDLDKLTAQMDKAFAELSELA
ncbi:MAG: wax ester/triacylglycerol synthase family O-acyltransferase [Xanthomonadales bacterium]|jgi:diacylglycerol O-acyltransferase|nr:wax ester/triacylglycerol synthase family O-acyltransferase [Xanthomonadales bacterium]